LGEISQCLEKLEKNDTINNEISEANKLECFRCLGEIRGLVAKTSSLNSHQLDSSQQGKLIKELEEKVSQLEVTIRVKDTPSRFPPPPPAPPLPPEPKPDAPFKKNKPKPKPVPTTGTTREMISELKEVLKKRRLST